jgi:BirA family biotin operon repressor/biotin-[acetyl-CoA-carboxylase] ligase
MLAAERISSIDSTQRECVRRLAHACEPFAVWTTEQTQGMASHGRRWHDSPDGLALSVAWPAGINEPMDRACWPSRIGLLVHGVLSARFPSRAHEFGLKWPNDLMGRGRKLGGVLVSRHRVGGTDWWVAGLGINLGWSSAVPELDRPVTDLASLGCSIEAPELAGLVIQTFDEVVIHQRDHLIHRSLWVEEFLRHDVLVNQSVNIVHPHSGSLLQQGVYRGMNLDGALLLETSSGLTPVRIGDASLRPTQG